MDRIRRPKSVGRTQRRGKLGSRLVYGKELEPTQESAKFFELFPCVLTSRFGKQLGDEEHRPDPCDGAGSGHRIGREQRTNSASKGVIGDGSVDQDIRVEGIHDSQGLSSRAGSSYLGHERLGLFLADGRSRSETPLFALREEIPDLFCTCHRFVGTARPERVRPNDNGDRPAMSGQGHLFPGEYPVEDLGKGGSCLTDGHRLGHNLKCTPTYITVQFVLFRLCHSEWAGGRNLAK